MPARLAATTKGEAAAVPESLLMSGSLLGTIMPTIRTVRR